MITVVGLNHRTAPIDVRERIALPKDQVPSALREVVNKAHIGEAMLISTCNRVELVTAGRSPTDDLMATAEEAADALAAIAPEVERHLYVYAGADAVRHLFRVASSLDSLVLGEPQILGQVKDAFELARKTGTVGRSLHRTVPRALRTAKRVRTETALGAGQVSVPSVAVDLARQIFGEIRGKNVVLIGSGEMAETVAKLLRNGGSRLIVVGRNAARVAVLSRAVEGEGWSWDKLPEALVEADVVVTSTSAPGFVVGRELLASLRRKRKGRSLFFIDLAVPRDVEPQVEALDGVFLYNVDDLSKVVAETLASRQREADRAETIVTEETLGWERWADAEQVTPAVVLLRERFSSVFRAELDKSLRGKLSHLGEEDRQALEVMLESALNKLLHAPTRRLREISIEQRSDASRGERLALTLDELFALEQEAAAQDEGPLDDEAASGQRGSTRAKATGTESR